MNGKCVGHSQGLCGPEDEILPVEIAGIFATQPNCQGIYVRGLTESESKTPSDSVTPVARCLLRRNSLWRRILQRHRKERRRGMVLHLQRPTWAFCSQNTLRTRNGKPSLQRRKGPRRGHRQERWLFKVGRGASLD